MYKFVGYGPEEFSAHSTKHARSRSHYSTPLDFVAIHGERSLKFRTRAKTTLDGVFGARLETATTTLRLLAETVGVSLACWLVGRGELAFDFVFVLNAICAIRFMVNDRDRTVTPNGNSGGNITKMHLGVFRKFKIYEPNLL